MVLAAALGELGEAGYGAFTIESVAARAGVAKSTIYRHWPDTINLIADAFETFHEQIVPHTGTCRPREPAQAAPTGLAIPVSIGIGAGSLIASALASMVGLTSALLACGSIAVAYGALLLRGTDRRASASAPAAIGQDGKSLLAA